MNTIVWYQLYAFIVSRSYDKYDEPNGYVFYNYCVFPSAERKLMHPMETNY